MKLLLRLFFAAVVLCVTADSSRAQASAPPSPTPAIQTGGEAAAGAAAEVWLGMVDDGRFPDSWQFAASIFQKDLPQEQWVKMLNDHRLALGKLLSRRRRGAQFAKTLVGAPDGQYVVILYDTSFENKPAAVESVSMVLDKDGLWKACGYYVR